MTTETQLTPETVRQADRRWRTPAYMYLRRSDRLPRTLDLPEDPICRVKLFNPTGAGTWWIAGYDPETGIAYGVAEIHEREAGSIYMPELVEYRGRFGLPIERDLHYTPARMSRLLSERS